MAGTVSQIHHVQYIIAVPENGTYPPTGNFIKENDNYPIGLGVLFPDRPNDFQIKEMQVGISVTTKKYYCIYRLVPLRLCLSVYIVR